MEYDVITQLFANQIFPVAMCVAFFVWFTKDYKTEQEKTREIISELKEAVQTLKLTAELFATNIKGDKKDE